MFLRTKLGTGLCCLSLASADASDFTYKQFPSPALIQQTLDGLIAEGRSSRTSW
jgi:hypothetical protein